MTVNQIYLQCHMVDGSALSSGFRRKSIMLQWFNGWLVKVHILIIKMKSLKEFNKQK